MQNLKRGKESLQVFQSNASPGRAAGSRHEGGVMGGREKLPAQTIHYHLHIVFKHALTHLPTPACRYKLSTDNPDNALRLWFCRNTHEQPLCVCSHTQLSLLIIAPVVCFSAQIQQRKKSIKVQL